MELSNPVPHEFTGKIQKEFFIQAEQDGLFFGFGFLRDLLKSDKFDSNITNYVEDGSCIFKEQICLSINLQNNSITKENLISIVSYLSGAYTLLSCFTEKNFDFSIMAFSTPKFRFSEWEEKAIVKAGGQIQKCPENICFQKEEVAQVLAKEEKQIVLSNLQIPKEEIKNILKSLPPFVTACLHGNLLPADLEEFSSFNLSAVWPLCLQGFFPRLKMKIIEESNLP